MGAWKVIFYNFSTGTAFRQIFTISVSSVGRGSSEIITDLPQRSQAPFVGHSNPGRDEHQQPFVNNIANSYCFRLDLSPTLAMLCFSLPRKNRTWYSLKET
jgi:hypothetical protein